VSGQQRKVPPPYRILVVGLTMPRPQLYQRIDERVDRMLAAGLEDEVRRLAARGYGFDLPAMSGVGYGQFEPYLSGEATLEEVLVAIKRATRRFVRHQGNWFRQGDPRIVWHDVGTQPEAGILELVRGFLVGGSSAMAQGPEPG
jgi:tRNA dimethylallyltransferase